MVSQERHALRLSALFLRTLALGVRGNSKRRRDAETGRRGEVAGPVVHSSFRFLKVFLLGCCAHRLVVQICFAVKSPFEKVTRFLKRHSMLEGSAGIVVAVSGGPDSVAMLDMLRKGAGGWGLGAGDEPNMSPPLANPQLPTPNPRLTNPQPLTPHLHIAHLDHMLRDRESAEDSEFVWALADRLGIPATISSIDVRAIAESAKRGIEEVARELRYEFLVNVARESGCDRIAVGHTMSDQAETVLMRLIRGTGLRGLAAMRPVGAVPPDQFHEQRRGHGDRLPRGRAER